MKQFLENRKLLAICGGGVGILLIGALIFSLVVLPNQRYENATDLFEASDYIAAYEMLQKVPENKNDTAELLPYYSAYATFFLKEYQAAADEFEVVTNYADSAEMAGYCQAHALLESGEYGDAYVKFSELGEFKDSADMLPECRYLLAQRLMEQADYAGALERFSALADYKDSAASGQECAYQIALKKLNAGAYGEAYNAFAALKTYGDSAAMLSECRYRMANDFIASGDFSGALERLDTLVGYKDCDDLAKECRYQQAAVLAVQNTVETLSEALNLLTRVGGYKDASAQIATLTAAIETAKKVPYTPPTSAFFDIDCTDAENVRIKAYKGAITLDKKTKIFSIPDAPENRYALSPSTGVGDNCVLVENTGEGEGYSISAHYIERTGRTEDAFSYGYYTTLRVKDGLEEGHTYKWDNHDLTATRWRYYAITVSGLDDSDAQRENIAARIARAEEVENFSGMPGGAIIFDEYNYIDISGLEFETVGNLSNKDSNVTVGGSLSNGARIEFSSWRSGGTLAETYGGYDIYVGNYGHVYCQVYPDIFVSVSGEKVVSSKEVVKTLIDNMHIV